VGGGCRGEGETFFKKFLPPPCLMQHPLNASSYKNLAFCMKAVPEGNTYSVNFEKAGEGVWMEER